MYVMAIRDEFPAEVLEVAKNLLENMENIPDLDASIRKDLRHLTCYAIDSEGAAEV
jgi:exoribonuclease R